MKFVGFLHLAEHFLIVCLKLFTFLQKKTKGEGWEETRKLCVENEEKKKWKKNMSRNSSDYWNFGPINISFFVELSTFYVPLNAYLEK
jgi:hypothetical protein